MKISVAAIPPVRITTNRLKDEEPKLQLVDGEGVDKRLHLSIRSLEIEVEIAKRKMPRDIQELCNALLKCRYDVLKARYDMVLYWRRLYKLGSDFWLYMNCRTMEELLVKLGLPLGQTLGSLELIVEAFDEDTFLLVGDDVLGDMMLLAAKYESDIPKRAGLYQDIFNYYCKLYTAFDKVSFQKIVNSFINQRYLKPEKPIASYNPTRRPGTGLPSIKLGIHSKKKVVEEVVQDADGGEKVVKVFQVEHMLCGGCKYRDSVIEAYKRHVERLEDIIKNDFGEDKVPPRPKIFETV